jgi:hypothetical protein
MINAQRQALEGSLLTARLETTITALTEVEQLGSSGDLDARVQRVFHNAMDHIRDSASTVQLRFGAQSQSPDPYAVLPALAAQPAHNAKQLAEELSVDLDNMDVSLETKGAKRALSGRGGIAQAPGSFVQARIIRRAIRRKEKTQPIEIGQDGPASDQQHIRCILVPPAAEPRAARELKDRSAKSSGSRLCSVLL